MEIKNEKFLVDRDEVLMLINKTFVYRYRDAEMVTSEELAVLDFAKEIADKISALDAQKIEGIDFTYGGRIPQEVVERCQFKEKENINE